MSDLDLDEMARWEPSGTSKPLDLAIRDIHALLGEVRALRERAAVLAEALTFLRDDPVAWSNRDFIIDRALADREGSDG